MTDITPEALEALSEEYRLTMDKDIVHSWGGDAARALYDIADQLRTGKLVMVDDGAVERLKFRIGDRVTKIKGSSWTGLVVGFYSTSLTPIGYAVESENEPGSVQIYPEGAIAALKGEVG